jgi:hypothetical protein
MKKIFFLILTLSIGISSISSAAGNDKVDNATLASFRQDFKSAKDVSWTETPSCYKAEFDLDGQILYAYYSKNEPGLIAVTRFILSNQLPLQLQQELRGKLKKDGWIADLFEVVSGGETYYYATVENSSDKIGYKSSGFSNWAQISKTEK